MLCGILLTLDAIIWILSSLFGILSLLDVLVLVVSVYIFSKLDDGFFILWRLPLGIDLYALKSSALLLSMFSWKTASCVEMILFLFGRYTQ
jgi:hypothetical protein